MLKKSLCLVLGFMCITDIYGSSSESDKWSPLNSFNSSGENDLNLEEDYNRRKEETALKRESFGDVNTQQNKKLCIEEYNTNTSEDESNITITNDKQGDSDINNVKESHIAEKEAIKSDPNIQEEATSGSGSCSNESSFEENTEAKNNNINEEDFAEESLVNKEKLSYEQNSLDKVKTIFKNLSTSQLWIGDISEIKDKVQRDVYINRINEALLKYRKYHDYYKRKQYDPRFLFTLMGMLGSYGNELDPDVDVKSILQDLWPKKSEIGEDKRAQGRLIYNWLAENEGDFLGEYYYD